MKYSFIIPTFNRVSELEELIPSLESMDFPKELYELVVVDDGSTDSTEELMMTYQAKLKLRITYTKQENLGPGAARNNGMNIAQGQYFIFVDSDCILPNDYLQEIEKSLEKQPLDAFGGPDTYHPSFSPLLKAINYSMTSFIGTGGTRGNKKSVTKFYPRSFNMGLDRKVVESIGGFSDIRHGQDMDYSARIYSAGFKVGLIADAYVYHKRRTSLWKFFKQIHNWGVTRINLASNHPGMLKLIHLLPVILVAGFALIVIGSLFLIYFQYLLGIAFLGIFGLMVLAFVQSFFMYKNLLAAFLSMFTLLIQIGAYGIGCINGIWQKLVLKKEEAMGITKNYYGKGNQSR